MNTDKKRQLNELFALNRRVMNHVALRYLKSWIDQLRLQRLKPMGILSGCQAKVALDVVQAVNRNIKALRREDDVIVISTIGC